MGSLLVRKSLFICPEVQLDELSTDSVLIEQLAVGLLGKLLSKPRGAADGRERQRQESSDQPHVALFSSSAKLKEEADPCNGIACARSVVALPFLRRRRTAPTSLYRSEKRRSEPLARVLAPDHHVDRVRLQMVDDLLRIELAFGLQRAGD